MTGDDPRLVLLILKLLHISYSCEEIPHREQLHPPLHKLPQVLKGRIRLKDMLAKLDTILFRMREQATNLMDLYTSVIVCLHLLL